AALTRYSELPPVDVSGITEAVGAAAAPVPTADGSEATAAAASGAGRPVSAAASLTRAALGAWRSSAPASPVRAGPALGGAAAGAGRALPLPSAGAAPPRLTSPRGGVACRVSGPWLSSRAVWITRRPAGLASAARLTEVVPVAPGRTWKSMVTRLPPTDV